MASRIEITDIIDHEHKFVSSNLIENGEFSYPEAFKSAGKVFHPIKNSKGRTYNYLDMRFVNDHEHIAVLVETKKDFSKCLNEAEEQLKAYMQYEYELTAYSIIGLLANTQPDDKNTRVWTLTLKNGEKHIHLVEDAKVLKTFEEYQDIILPKKINNREQVMRSTYQLNEMMHKYSIPENLRSQFVGTCLIALNDVKFKESYKTATTKMIIAGIHDILSAMLTNNLEKANKLSLLNTKVLGNQYIRDMKDENLHVLLQYIDENINPYINDKTTQGQDLLNLFFTIFNKYVGKTDKNQAFTPDHIVEFMCKAIGIGKNSVVLDPCCGSGAFLVRAMTEALDKCDTEEEKKRSKKNTFGVLKRKKQHLVFQQPICCYMAMVTPM